MRRLPLILASVAAAMLAACGGSDDEGGNANGKGSGGPDFPPAAKGPAYTGDKITLQIRFKPGKYRMLEQMHQKMKTTIRAEGRTMSQSTGMDLQVFGDLTIDPPNHAGERRVLYTCTGMKVAANAGGRTLRFDSDTPNSGSRDLRFLGALVGRKLEQFYSRDGTFLRIDGLETMLSQMAAGATAGRAQMEQMRKMLVPMFKEILTRHWGKLIPTEPLAPNDTWRRTVDLTTVPVLGKLDTHFACRMGDIETRPLGPVALIGCNVLAETYFQRMSGKDSPFPKGVDVVMEEFKMSGPMNVYFDTDIGLATKVESQFTIAGRMRITPPKGAAGTADMDGSVNVRAYLVREGEEDRLRDLMANGFGTGSAAGPSELSEAAIRRARRAKPDPADIPAHRALTRPYVPPEVRDIPARALVAKPAPALPDAHSRGRIGDSATSAMLNHIMEALRRYQLHTGRFPRTEEGLAALVTAPAGVKGWKGPYLKLADKKDRWGREFQYACPGRRSGIPFDVWSLGPDGKPGTDDIGSWQE